MIARSAFKVLLDGSASRLTRALVATRLSDGASLDATDDCCRLREFLLRMK
jgi:hypothetical protein